MDKILIENARLCCSMGITAEERKAKQLLAIYLMIFTDIRAAALQDDITKTVDYSMVWKSIKELVGHEYNLIETLAEDIAKKVLSEFSVQKVQVRVVKPGAFKDADYAAVEIVREKNAR